jgi:CubicO group peptidase (beta-lactamase class C family)
LFPQTGRTFANPDPQRENITLEDLLTMRSRLDWQEGDPIYREMGLSLDLAQFVRDRPMTETPGSRFNYCSGCSHLLSPILQQATGMDTRAFAEQYLFEPLEKGMYLAGKKRIHPIRQAHSGHTGLNNIRVALPAGQGKETRPEEIPGAPSGEPVGSPPDFKIIEGGIEDWERIKKRTGGNGRRRTP